MSIFNIEVNETYTFKLTSGEEFVAKVLSIGDYLVVKQPISMVFNPQGLQMIPSLFSSNQDKDVRINMSSIAMIAHTREDVATKYIEAVTGIVTPQQKQIITG